MGRPKSGVPHVGAAGLVLMAALVGGCSGDVEEGEIDVNGPGPVKNKLSATVAAHHVAGPKTGERADDAVIQINGDTGCAVNGDIGMDWDGLSDHVVLYAAPGSKRSEYKRLDPYSVPEVNTGTLRTLADTLAVGKAMQVELLVRSPLDAEERAEFDEPVRATLRRTSDLAYSVQFDDTSPNGEKTQEKIECPLTL